MTSSASLSLSHLLFRVLTRVFQRHVRFIGDLFSELSASQSAHRGRSNFKNDKNEPINCKKLDKNLTRFREKKKKFGPNYRVSVRSGSVIRDSDSEAASEIFFPSN